MLCENNPWEYIIEDISQHNNHHTMILSFVICLKYIFYCKGCIFICRSIPSIFLDLISSVSPAASVTSRGIQRLHNIAIVSPTMIDNGCQFCASSYSHSCSIDAWGCWTQNNAIRRMQWLWLLVVKHFMISHFATFLNFGGKLWIINFWKVLSRWFCFKNSFHQQTNMRASVIKHKTLSLILF